MDSVTAVVSRVLAFTDRGTINRGAYPRGELVNDGRGFLWGTTVQGGQTRHGTIYKVGIASGKLTTVVEFSRNGAVNKGAAPYSGLSSDGKGYLWGTTSLGGSANYGTVFKINVSTGKLTTVLSFTKSGITNKGANPFGTLIRDGSGMFWGTTFAGGSRNYGTVFKVNPVTGLLKTVVEFTHTGKSNRGANPRAGLVADASGNVWGTTESGGSKSLGTIFKVNRATGVMTTVVEFTGRAPANKGGNPRSALVSDGQGNLWGTTKKGGADDFGTVFKLNLATAGLMTMVEFGPYASSPTALETDGQNFLWGTTSYGGSRGFGTIFKLTPSTGERATVVEFAGAEALNRGAFPHAPLMNDGNGCLWGSTVFAGGNDMGTIFKLNMTTGVLTTIVEFTGRSPGKLGTSPWGKLMNDGTGFLWGTTLYGGISGNGTVFRINASSGEFTSVVNFTGDTGSALGAYPSAGLVSDGNGFLWGTTQEGGGSVWQRGTIFKLNPLNGVMTTVVEFTYRASGNVGNGPIAGPVNEDSGYLWGTTNLSWENGVSFGTIYKVNALTGELVTVANFSDGTLNYRGGMNPESGLVSDGKGFFWGTTSSGGAFGCGILYKVNAATGALSKELDFSGYGSQANSGSEPGPGNLILHSDGYLYGTTLYGGPGGGGTIYRFKP